MYSGYSCCHVPFKQDINAPESHPKYATLPDPKFGAKHQPELDICEVAISDHLLNGAFSTAYNAKENLGTALSNVEEQFSALIEGIPPSFHQMVFSGMKVLLQIIAFRLCTVQNTTISNFTTIGEINLGIGVYLVAFHC